MYYYNLGNLESFTRYISHILSHIHLSIKIKKYVYHILSFNFYSNGKTTILFLLHIELMNYHVNSQIKIKLMLTMILKSLNYKYY